jgi:hypothetical protein
MDKKLNFMFWIVLVIIMLFALASQVKAKPTQLIVDDRNPYEQPILIRATVYTSEEGAQIASGQSIREGIIAGKPEWEGCVAILYTYRIEDGQAYPQEVIGIYEVLDTGAGIDTDGDNKGDSIKNGTSIDVYQPTQHQAEEWIDTYGDYVMVMLIRGKG